MPEIKSYVCGFMISDGERVQLLRKLRPSWQEGLLNGVGGKIEAGEDPECAMHREWGEETGDDTIWPWREFALLKFQSARVHFFITRVSKIPEIPAFNDVGEHFVCCHMNEIINGHAQVIPNLPWLLGAAIRDPFPMFITAREIGVEDEV